MISSYADVNLCISVHYSWHQLQLTSAIAWGDWNSTYWHWTENVTNCSNNIFQINLVTLSLYIFRYQNILSLPGFIKFLLFSSFMWCRIRCSPFTRYTLRRLLSDVIFLFFMFHCIWCEYLKTGFSSLVYLFISLAIWIHSLFTGSNSIFLVHLKLRIFLWFEISREARHNFFFNLSYSSSCTQWWSSHFDKEKKIQMQYVTK